jgi:hypothetical protein
MNENAWSILVEVTTDENSNQIELSKIRQTLAGLNLPETFTQRLQSTLAETLVNYRHRQAQENTSFAITLRILSNFANASVESSWGFFIVEKGAEPNHAQVLELYLYQDDKEK